MAFADPWAGFRGRYEIPISDLVERHDFYIGEDALKTHEEEEDGA